MDNWTFLLLITVLCLLAVAKVTAQSAGAKRLVRTPLDSILFIALFFFFTSLAFLPSLLASPPPFPVVLYATLAAVLNLAFQVTYTIALAKGPVGITALISSLSMIIPMLGATLFLGESFGILRIVGLVLTFTALYLNTDFKRGARGFSRIWTIAAVLCFLSNGFASFWQKIFALSDYGTEIAGYSFFSYFLASVIAILALLILGRKKEWRPTAPLSRSLFGWCALVGLFLGCFQWFFTYSQRVVEASLLLPFHSGTSTLLMTVVGVVLFKERLSPRRIAGVAVGIAAIVLFGIAQ